MNRLNSSLWLKDGMLPQFRRLEGNHQTEVAVVGAGITGITTAYLLSNAGQKVTVLDQRGLAGGESAYTTAHLTEILDDRYYQLEKWHGPKNARLVRESHAKAIDLIEEIVKKEQIDCDFERVEGRLQFGPDEVEAMELEWEALQRLGLKKAKKEATNLIIPNQAKFHPLKYLKALYEILEKRGVEFYETEVHSVEEHGPKVICEGDGATLSSLACVVATHSPFLNRLRLHTKLYPYLTYVVAAEVPKKSVANELFWESSQAYHYVRLYEKPDSDVLIIGGEDHKCGQEENPQRRFRRLEKWAIEHYPQIKQFDLHWSGQVLETMDGLAYIGKNPGSKNIYVATGFSGNGLTYGTLSALLIRDLILEKNNAWTRLYRPTRINLYGLKTFVKENTNVFLQFLKKFLPKPSTTIDIPTDEGKVIEQNSEKVAAYKDKDGNLHLYSAVCPHLGCIVNWNSSSKTWDCPCHGSRFTTEGKVLNGPAQEPLKKLTD